MNKFDWTKWSAIAEISSAIAIVITLLYLADQTRELRVQTEQNYQMLASESRLRLLDNRGSLSWRVVESPELASLVARLRAGEEISDEEQVQVEQMIYRLLTNWEFEVKEILAGRLEIGDVPVESWRSWYYGNGTMGLPPLHEYLQQDFWDPAFIEFMQREVVEPGPP